jgi:sugar lactone lactonase YvrE
MPSASPTHTTAASPPPTSTTRATPAGYRVDVVHRAGDHPDDLVQDPSGALLYSDYTNGTISRLNPDGSSTVLHRGLPGPEGMVFLRDGTLVVAEEDANRLVAFAPGQSTPTVLATLPGTSVKATCHQGVDGIAWDATTTSLVVPDPVTGTVYRISPDGATRSVLARGFVHPVGAAVGPDGSVYVADECGGGVWRLGRGGSRARVAEAVMPDDLAFDAAGNLLVTDVRHTRHDVRRWAPGGGGSTVLVRTGLIEPQGLLVTASGTVYVADDQARVILRLTPRS